MDYSYNCPSAMKKVKKDTTKNSLSSFEDKNSQVVESLISKFYEYTTVYHLIILHLKDQLELSDKELIEVNQCLLEKKQSILILSQIYQLITKSQLALISNNQVYVKHLFWIDSYFELMKYHFDANQEQQEQVCNQQEVSYSDNAKIDKKLKIKAEKKNKCKPSVAITSDDNDDISQFLNYDTFNEAYSHCDYNLTMNKTSTESSCSESVSKINYYEYDTYEEFQQNFKDILEQFSEAIQEDLKVSLDYLRNYSFKIFIKPAMNNQCLRLKCYQEAFRKDTYIKLNITQDKTLIVDCRNFLQVCEIISSYNKPSFLYQKVFVCMNYNTMLEQNEKLVSN